MEKNCSYFFDLWGENISLEEKQAFYELLYEIFLKQKTMISPPLLKNYEIWISQDLKQYQTQEDLEKNQQDLNNFKNYLKIQLHVDLHVYQKRDYNPVDTSSLLPFHALVMQEIVLYFEWLVEEIVKPDIENLKVNLEYLSSHHDHQRIYPIYLTFMLFKARKIRRGYVRIWDHFKDINSEMTEDLFLRFNNCLAKLSASPLLVGIRERYKFKSTFEFKIMTIIDSENKNVILNSIIKLIDKMTDHWDKFESSYKRLTDTAQNNGVLLLDFFSHRRKLSDYSLTMKSNWEYVNEFLAFAYTKMHDAQTLEDLENLSIMKFYLKYLKCGILDFETNKLAETYYKFWERGSTLHFKILSNFSKDYLPSQIQEFDEFYRKKNVFNVNLINPMDKVNSTYQMIIYSNDCDCFMKTYKLIKRIYNLPKRIDSFKNKLSEDISNKEKAEKIYEKFVINLLTQYVDFDAKTTNQAIDYYSATEIFMKSILLSRHVCVYLQNNFENPTAYVIGMKNKFLKKAAYFNEEFLDFLKKNSIYSDFVIENNLGIKQISNDLFSKMILRHISNVNYNIHLLILDKIEQCVTLENPRMILLDKIAKKLPYFRKYLKFLNDYVILTKFDHINFFDYLTRNAQFADFSNTVDDKKCQINLTKMYCVVAEEAFNFLMKVQYYPDEYIFYAIFNLIKPIYRSSHESKEIQQKNQKFMLLKICEIFQFIFNIYGVNFNLKESWSFLKECENGIADCENLMPVQLEIQGLAECPKMNKFLVFISIFYTIVQLMDFYDYRPNLNYCYLQLFGDQNFVQHLLDLLVKIKKEFSNDKENTKLHKDIDRIFCNALTYLAKNLKNYWWRDDETKYVKYDQIVETVKNVFEVYCNNRKENFNDPISLFQTIILILGYISKEENPEIAQKIINTVYHIMLGIKENYFGTSNIHYITLIWEKLILFYDEKDVLQKMNIELKIKEVFYDPFLTKPKYSLKIEEFNVKLDLMEQFNLNGKVFYEVFNNICTISEDKLNIVLKEGTGIVYYF